MNVVTVRNLLNGLKTQHAGVYSFVKGAHVTARLQVRFDIDDQFCAQQLSVPRRIDVLRRVCEEFFRVPAEIEITSGRAQFATKCPWCHQNWEKINE